MRELRAPLSVLACAALLTSQLGGLHMHVDSEGYAGTPVGTHVHRTAVYAHDGGPDQHADESDHAHPGDPDHEGDHDVVVELVNGASKLPISFAFVGLGLIVQRLGTEIHMPAAVPRPKGRRDRWRPPLRAPPPFSPR